MDLLRTLLCLGLVTLVWKVRLREIRPVRDFVLWGLHYPLHFALIGVLILTVWGVVGADYGLQTLFLDDNPLVQVEVGAVVMLLFSALVFHYSVLDAPERWMSASLGTTTNSLRGLSSYLPPGHPAQSLLRNGFLERLGEEDLAAIARVIRSGGVGTVNPAHPTAAFRELLQGEASRLLFAPAVLLAKNFMLAALLGVVPALVMPISNGDPSAIWERLPWLVGVVSGGILGIVLTCWTTSWLAGAVGWDDLADRVLAFTRAPGLPEAGRPGPEPDEPPSAEHGVGGPASSSGGTWPRGAPSQMRAPTRVRALIERRGYALLLMFFVVHAVIHVGLPDSLVARWAEWPERTFLRASEAGRGSLLSLASFRSLPWRPTLLLLGEGAVAAALLATGTLTPVVALRSRIATLAGPLRRGLRRTLDSVLDVGPPAQKFLLGGCLAFLAIGAVIVLVFGPAVAGSSLGRGLLAFPPLAAFLLCWTSCFRMTTWFEPHLRRASPMLSAAPWLWLVGLTLLYLAGFGDALVILSTTLAAGALVPSVIGPGARFSRFGLPGRASLITAMGVATVAALLLAWRLSVGPQVAALWIGLAILYLSAATMARSLGGRPVLVYPLALIFGFVAFAIPFNALGERWQSCMPAAASIACLIALMTSAYTAITYVWPRRGPITVLALLAGLVLLNGNAWFVAPNEFKTPFPGMGRYYAVPIDLDTRAYFRETTASTVRLRYLALTRDVDRLEDQVGSERLATAYFRLLDESPHSDAARGGLRLAIEDMRNRLRARVGEEFRLVAEGSFPAGASGDQCVVRIDDPVFQKIYRSFHFDRLQFLRDGVVRGREVRLTTVEGRGSAAKRYRLVSESRHSSGLVIDGLGAACASAGARDVLLSAFWSGRVTAVRVGPDHNTYEVEFPTAPGNETLGAAERESLASWLEQRHLDLLRPGHLVESGRPERAGGRASWEAPSWLPEGDCAVLEDIRGEIPIPIAPFLPTRGVDTTAYPEFAGLWLTPENVAHALRTQQAQPSMPPPAASRPDYSIRPALDRGLFASPDRQLATLGQLTGSPGGRAEVVVALYNTSRIRPGDRLILRWRTRGGAGGPEGPVSGGVFAVRRIDDGRRHGTADESLPRGYRWVTLDAISIEPAPGGSIETAGEPLVLGEWQLLRLLGNIEVLRTWKDLVAPRWGGRKPKLVIVTVSGGGIRASVWTATVLRKLETTLGADFPYHIRLITGASGGMVGGSYYATTIRPPAEGVLRGQPARFETVHDITGDDLVEDMSSDQLNAVAGRTAFADVLSVFNPFLQKGDRGRTLEQTWIRETDTGRGSPFARPLQDYAAGERMGWRPSLVYTPMMVEDGRRLLISNLDLAFATRNVGGLLLEPSSRKIERPAFQEEDLDQSIHMEDEVFSLSAIEFFRLFPNAHDFGVSTAVRMSASFPWVSPAVSLPTLPPRRVVDAGYYDNYGVNLAALWLTKVREWLVANTSGVVVIQIRDSVSQEARVEIDFDRLTDWSGLDRLTWQAPRDLLIPGFQAVGTPLSGVSNARQWTMSFRNDEQVDLLDLLFDEDDSDFFRTVVFECPVKVSLNWKLTDREKQVLAGGFGTPGSDPSQEFARVKNYLIGEDAAELHKWSEEHRDDPSSSAELKRRYDEQLRRLGIVDTRHLDLAQSRALYENLMKNLMRLLLLRDWWQEGRGHTG